MPPLPRLGALLLICLALPALAQDSAPVLQGPWGPMREESPARPIADAADATIRLRQSHMRGVSAQYRALETLVVSGAGTSALALSKAEALHRSALENAEIFRAVAPRGSRFGAKRAIWEEPAEFAEHVSGFTAATAALVRRIQAGEAAALPAALAETRYQCLACHYHYADWEGRPGREGRRAR